MYGEKLQEVNEWFASWIQKIPSEQKDQAVEILDHLIMYMSNFYQQKERIAEIERKILLEARLFQEGIQSIEEIELLSIHQVDYIAEKWKTKYTMYALVEGGIAGLGHSLFLLLDFPALLAINMKMVHSIANSYGYSLSYPTEQVLALKVLHAGSLAKPYQELEMEWLREQYVSGEESFIHAYQDQMIIQKEWLETLAKQWIKSLFLYGMKHKSNHSFPLLGVALGANLNYQFTKQVAQFASSFYHERFMNEQRNDVHEYA
jgi:hypothetical protein